KLVPRGTCRANPRFDFRQGGCGVLGKRATFFDSGHCGLQLVFTVRELLGAMGLLIGPFLDLLLQLPAPGLYPIPGLYSMTDFSFQSTDLSSGLEQAALGCVYGI